MAHVIYRGRIAGDFEGFDGDRLFKMANGTYWIQAQYRYWYRYAYRPEAVITEDRGHRLLTVAGHTVRVEPIHDVIESRIDGAFEGWQGDSVYKLLNGQVWQQSAYKYEYRYAYRPEVVVYSMSGGYLMQVAGTDAQVKRLR